jgi:hypothetical protein
MKPLGPASVAELAQRIDQANRRYEQITGNPPKGWERMVSNRRGDMREACRDIMTPQFEAQFAENWIRVKGDQSALFEPIALEPRFSHHFDEGHRAVARRRLETRA